MTVDVPVNCKFCGKPIVLKIEKSYFELRDPYRLIRMAACEACADMKVKQRRLMEELSRISAQLAMVRDGVVKASLIESARRCLQGYVRLIGHWLNIPHLAWDEAILDAFAASPREVGSVISKVWQMAKSVQSQSDLLLPEERKDLESGSHGLPYKD